jgi:nitrate/TMAO reductase-like tetraheme cytochrome c subunit
MAAKIAELAGRYGVVFFLGVVFAVAAFLAINAISRPLATSTFCGTACHELEPAYKGYLESPHNLNSQGLKADCVDCHLPPKEQFFRNLFEKARTGSVELWRHYFGPQYERDKIIARVKAGMKNTTCLYCHKDLLASPSSRAVYYMHKGSLAAPGDPWGKCTACHTAHARKQNRLAEPP